MSNSRSSQQWLEPPRKILDILENNGCDWDEVEFKEVWGWIYTPKRCGGNAERYLIKASSFFQGCGMAEGQARDRALDAWQNFFKKRSKNITKTYRPEVGDFQALVWRNFLFHLKSEFRERRQENRTTPPPGDCEAADHMDLFRDEQVPNPSERLLQEESVAIQEEIIAILKTALRKMNEDDRQILEWHFLGRIDYREIAQNLGLTAPNARQRGSRALKCLREIFLKGTIGENSAG